MAKSKPAPLVLPVGEDLAKTLQFAYPGQAYALYGIQVDQIKIEPDPSLMEIPDENTLVWMQSDQPAPTLLDLAQAYQQYQLSIVTPLNIKGFELAVYGDADLQQALMSANPIVFSMLMRLLDGLDVQNPELTPVKNAVVQLRKSMQLDFTADQVQRLNTFAQLNGLQLTF